MLKTRILSALVGIPLIIFFIWRDGWFCRGLFLLIGLGIVKEMQNIISKRGVSNFKILPYVLFIIIFFAPILDVYANLSVVLFLLLTSLVFVIAYPGTDMKDMALCFWMPVYAGFLLSYILKIQFLNSSFYLLLLTFIITWCSDIGGYIFGRLLGKHKLAPRLSPKKTWEGCLGCLFLTVLGCVLFNFFAAGLIFNYSYAYAVVLGVTGSMAAQLGDLMISGVKRTFKVKDSGSLIPGHGGVLDRFDSFLLVLPVVYYFYMFINLEF
ncbi:MAG: phosphatidate cytidylyltransferase [Syntrophomonadaceae bacterium]|jgi:phosphatidate cytidylyltransferase|nr:phosphatidate cytidylyltransferase [Syntrophomonadaceae bacterium]